MEIERFSKDSENSMFKVFASKSVLYLFSVWPLFHSAYIWAPDMCTALSLET